MSDPELDAQQEAEYAELLAAYLPPAVPVETVPDGVSARLDQTLAELVVERQRDVPPALRPAAPGDPAARNRRRRLGGALLAAAAVTVGGFAVVPAWLAGQGGDAESADTAISADAGGGADDGADSGDDDRARDERGDTLDDGAVAAPVPASLPRVRTDYLEEDVVRLVEEGAVTETSGRAGSWADREEAERDGVLSYDLKAQTCTLPRLEDDATWLVVDYAGEPAVLVADPEDAPPPRTATLLPCEGGPALAEFDLSTGGR